MALPGESEGLVNSLIALRVVRGKIMKYKQFLAILIASVIVTLPVSAHHSFATHYDAGNIVEISGVLSDVKMRNPHSFFEVDVTNAAGETETWEVEAHAVPVLRRIGITRDTLKVGDSVTIRGPRSRRPEKLLLFGAQIKTGSGQEFEMLDSIRQAPDYYITDTREGLERLTGKWMTYITGQKVSDTPMPVNAAGQKARDEYNAHLNSSSSCVPMNLPSLLMLPYVYQIELDGDTLDIFHEYSKVRRPVDLDSDSRNVTDPTFGSRSGRYENGTLIIETRDFPSMDAGLASAWDPNGNGKDIPSSEQKVLVERYKVSDDGAMLILNYTVTDPAYLTEPFSDEITWHRMPEDSPIYEFDCDADIALRSTQNAATLNE